jgi:hypothetical protein
MKKKRAKCGTTEASIENESLDKFIEDDEDE